MNKILIDMVTGTVLNYDDQVVIVDVNTLDEAGNALMEEWNVTGSDETIMQVGLKYGTPVVSHFTRELGASISYSPQSIRELMGEMLDNGMEGDDVEWAYNTATDDQLFTLSQWILNSDPVWGDYSSNITEAVEWGYSEHLKGTL